MDGTDDTHDDDEYLNFGSSSVRPRFKNGINLQRLIREGTSFEVDTDEGGELLEDSEGIDEPSFAELYKNQVVEKKNESLKALFKAMALEGVSGNYDELATTMDNVNEDGGVKKLIVKAGIGKKVDVSSKIYAHYIAVSEGSDEPYDSTLVRGRPQMHKLAEADMIPGFYLALLSMKIGEIAKFLVEPEYAYKGCGIPPRVPPDCRILYLVELVEAVQVEKLNDILMKSVDERGLLQFSEICKEAQRLRTEGNDIYVESRYNIAIRRYRDAIRILEDYPVVSEENENTRNEILFTLYINLAQSYLKLQKGPQACVASRMALRFDGASKGKLYKALFRFARAKFLLGSYEEAKSLCERASKLAPVGTKSITEFLKEIVQKIQEDEMQLKFLYKRMLRNGSVETLSASNGSIETLSASSGSFETLSASSGSFETLSASSGSFETLSASNGSVETLSASNGFTDGCEGISSVVNGLTDNSDGTSPAVNK